MNHTGTAHPWFTEASSSSESPYRNYYSFSEDPKTDIAAGKIAMITQEGAAGYNAAEWFQVSDETAAVKGLLKFTLDWSNASSPYPCRFHEPPKKNRAGLIQTQVPTTPNTYTTEKTSVKSFMTKETTSMNSPSTLSPLGGF